jgi:hypothetical protein
VAAVYDAVVLPFLEFHVAPAARAGERAAIWRL